MVIKTAGNILISVLFSLLGILLALVLVEAIYRVSNRFAAVPPSWNDRPTYYYNPINSGTLQGNVYQTDKPAGVYRVAVIGDSFTFGPYMQWDDTFPARLERMFRMSGHSNIEVINYGVPGYSTDHEVVEARKAIAEGADLIILQITLNDPQIKSYQPTGMTGFNEFGPYQPTERLAPLLKRWRSLGYFLERLHNTETHRRYKNYFFKLFEGPATWNHFSGSLARLARVAKRDSVPLVAVVFPLYGLPLDQDYPFFPLHQKVAAELKKLNVPTLDLFDTHKDIPLARIQVIPDDDRHPNEIGHRLAAERIHAWLEELAIMPERYFQIGRFKNRIDIRLLNKNSYAGATSE